MDKIEDDFQKIPKGAFFDPEYDIGYKKGIEYANRYIADEFSKWIIKTLSETDTGEDWVINARRKYESDKKMFGQADDGELLMAKENMSGALAFRRALNIAESNLRKITQNHSYTQIKGSNN